MKTFSRLVISPSQPLRSAGTGTPGSITEREKRKRAIMPGESWSHHIAGTRSFRPHLRHQIRMSCRLLESHENPTSTGDGRAMMATLTYHKPSEGVCMLPYLPLAATLLQSQRNDRTRRVLTSGSGMLFSRSRFPVSKNARPSSTRYSAKANCSSKLSAHLQ